MSEGVEYGRGARGEQVVFKKGMSLKCRVL